MCKLARILRSFGRTVLTISDIWLFDADSMVRTILIVSLWLSPGSRLQVTFKVVSHQK